ncbi:MAG: type II toxin-antitoxin system RelE/ParE family toxin [Verrucomicrobiales bacterium]
MTYRFLTPALRELAHAAEFYEEKVPGLGADFIGELDAAIERILQFPEAWGRVSDDFRACHLRRFPYSVIYTRPEVDLVLIVSVFHQARRPESWKRNL